jgi:1-acyl-sn-glycerol-3-phosphate acyltransferase
LSQSVIPVFHVVGLSFSFSNALMRVWRKDQLIGFPQIAETLTTLGTHSKGRGLGVAKTGTARLALDANCLIVPMARVGSDRFFRHFPRHTRVTISLLPPILTNPDDTPLSLTNRLMFTIAAALPPEMRGVYAEKPKGFE